MDQVDKDLLNLNPVSKYLNCCRIEIKLNVYAKRVRACQCERASFLDYAPHVFDAIFSSTARDKLAQTLNDLSTTQRLAGGLLQNLRHVGDLVRVPVQHDAAHRVHRIGDRGQRLIQLMSERSSQI